MATRSNTVPSTGDCPVHSLKQDIYTHIPRLGNTPKRDLKECKSWKMGLRAAKCIFCTTHIAITNSQQLQMSGPALYKHGPIDDPLRVEEGLRGPYPSWLNDSLWVESGKSGNAFHCVPPTGTPATYSGESHTNAYTDNPGQTKWGTEQNRNSQIWERDR